MADQLRASVQRIRGGEMGMLPALAGLLVLSILFGFLNPFFFTKGNVANLMTQTAALMMLSIALTFVIILTEIDLSAGITGGVGMAVFIILVNDKTWNWLLAFVVALLVGAVIGTVLGWFVAKVGIPSFVVSLGLFLAFQGLMLVLLGDAGTYQIQTPEVAAIMNKSMPPWAGWLMLVIIVLVSLGTGLYDRMRRLAGGDARPADEPAARPRRRLGGGRRVHGVPAEPEPGQRAHPDRGCADRGADRPDDPVGRHVDARPDAFRSAHLRGGRQSRGREARRASVFARVRITAFIICSMLAVVSGLFTVSQTGVVQSSTGRDIVLFGVGAAVVGGVSLFGGRGRLAAGHGRRAAHLDDHQRAWGCSATRRASPSWSPAAC